jgi:hypothetical protein
MRLARHVGVLLLETIRMSARTRRLSLLVAVIGGLILLLLVIAVQLAAPIAIYPFA